MENNIDKTYKYTQTWTIHKPTTQSKRLKIQVSTGRLSHKILNTVEMSIIVAYHTTDIKPMERHSQPWDNDSGPVGIDNRYSGCMSYTSANFVSVLQDYNRVIKGFGGKLKWHWKDDNDKVYIFIIPNSFYISERKVRLPPP